MKKCFIQIILLLTFVSSEAFALNERIIIEDYSYKDGLKTSWVFNVHKDSKGFLWICSENGLFRFDGYNFRNINTIAKNDLNLQTFCITEDRQNNFFIGTPRGIYYYNTKYETIFPLNLSVPQNCMVYKILIIKNKLWVASNIGLLMVDYPENPDQEHLLQTKILLPDSLHTRTPQDNIINTIYYSPRNPALWVGTNGALYVLDMNKLVFQHIDSYNQNSIRGISEYKNHLIVSSWDGGVFLVNPLLQQLDNDDFINKVNRTLHDKRIMSALEDDQGRLWIASYGHGLYIFRKNKTGTVSISNYRNDQKQQINLKTDFINQLYIDNTGIVWLSQIQPGLSKAYFQKSDLRYFSIFQNKHIQPSEIQSINLSSDKNKLWITTNGSGLFLFDTENHKTTNYSSGTNKGIRLQSNYVKLCHQDVKGNLWIVYHKLGLYVVPSKYANGLIAGESAETIQPVDANNLVNGQGILNSYTTEIFEDDKNRLWFGGWGSLHVVELPPGSAEFLSTGNLLQGSKTTCIFSEEKQDKIDFPISPIVSFAQINEKNILAGSMGTGIIQIEEFAPDNFSSKISGINKKLPVASIKALFKDRSNNLWIGTHAGIYCWKYNTDNIISFTIKEGLFSEDVKYILEDSKSNIWISTSFGISKINTKDFTVSNYLLAEDDKLNQYIAHAGAYTEEGLTYFSTNQSLVFFNPDSIFYNLPTPPLYFTDIKVDNKTVVPMGRYYGTTIIDANVNSCNTINIPYNHTLSIEFAALDFINSDRFLYKYRLGDNNEWIILNTNQRSLIIPKLKPGEYTLDVMLSNDQHENIVRSTVINYLPPFWLTNIAYVIYCIIFLIILITYRKFLIQRILQKSILENERNERKKSEELEKMKSEFFSNISHEFRTPLSLIINPLERLLKAEEISNRSKEKIELVLKSSNRLLKLTNELMDFSKIEKKLITPDFRLVEIVALVNDVCQLFNNIADSMNCDFKTNCSFEQLEIPIDEGMIEKVIFNLLSNAFKYTPVNGTIMVNITKVKEAEKEYVKLSFINTGNGIADENLSKIFDRYYQVDNIQNRNTEGTGIGLALVKSFIDLHDGRVEVKSEPNLETCFDIYLPVIQINFDKSKAINSLVTDRKPKRIIEKREDIVQTDKPILHYQLLIIEDDQDIRDFIIEELSTEFRMLSAPDGETGLKMAKELIPDLIILDVVMPGISGYELCKKIKNDVVTSHIPVLMLSAKTSIEDQIEGLETGADVYMTKPFSIDHLIAQILSLLSFKQTIFLRYLKETELIPQGALTTRLDEEFMQKVTDFVENNLTNSDLCVDQLAKCVSLSKVQTYRKIKAISGLSIVEFIRTIRLKKAAQMILEDRLNFSEIAFETGFSTPSYFSKCFHDHFGKTPSEFAMNFKNSL